MSRQIENIFSYTLFSLDLRRQSSGDVLSKTCSENMQQIYRVTPMLKCDFNKAVIQIYWNHTLACVFSCKCAACFQNTFSWEHIRKAASGSCYCCLCDLIGSRDIKVPSISRDFGEIFSFFKLVSDFFSNWNFSKNGF